MRGVAHPECAEPEHRIHIARRDEMPERGKKRRLARRWQPNNDDRAFRHPSLRWFVEDRQPRKCTTRRGCWCRCMNRNDSGLEPKRQEGGHPRSSRECIAFGRGRYPKRLNFGELISE